MRNSEWKQKRALQETLNPVNSSLTKSYSNFYIFSVQFVTCLMNIQLHFWLRSLLYSLNVYYLSRARPQRILRPAVQFRRTWEAAGVPGLIYRYKRCFRVTRLHLFLAEFHIKTQECWLDERDRWQQHKHQTTSQRAPASLSWQQNRVRVTSCDEANIRFCKWVSLLSMTCSKW